MYKTHFYFSQAYGEGSYNTSDYNGSTTSSGTPATSTPQGSGVLANTGVELLAGATLASVIIFSALIIRFWKKPARSKSAE
jgi:hypothetical protein